MLRAGKPRRLGVGDGAPTRTLSGAFMKFTLPLLLSPLPLEQLGVDYTQLRDLLKAGDWRAAEDEQRAKLIEAAGACRWLIRNVDSEQQSAPV